MGYTVTEAEGIPGFYTVVDTGRPGPEVLVLGEMDALLCPDHPDADPQTGAAHCCGHSAQCAALVGIAAALTELGVLDALSGRIRLCAVPAEELIELDYRAERQKRGEIRYLTGKREFLYRGYFDGVDMAMLGLLLQNGAERARSILATAQPLFDSYAAYFDYVDSRADSGERITYGDGEATVRL